MAHPIDVQVGKRLRQRRRQMNMTLEQLGKRAGVALAQVQKYEAAVNRISASRLWIIATALGAPVSYFFEGAENLTGSKFWPLDVDSAEEQGWADPLMRHGSVSSAPLTSGLDKDATL